MSDSLPVAEPKPEATLGERAQGLTARMIVRLCGAFLDDPATPPGIMKEAIDELQKQVKSAKGTRARRGAADILLKHAVRVAALGGDPAKADGPMQIIVNILPPPRPEKAVTVVVAKPETNGNGHVNGNGSTNGHA